MPARRLSVVVARPLDDVFEYMNDVSREKEWQPQLEKAEQIPPGPTAVGSERRYVSSFMGRRVENRYVVRVWEPKRRIVLQTTPDSTLDATSEVTWEPVDGGTKVSMAVDGRPKGALKLLPRKVLERTFENELTETLRRLKRALESGS